MERTLTLRVLKARTSGKSENFDLSWIRSGGAPIGPLSLSTEGQGVRTSLLGPTSEGIEPMIAALYQRIVTLRTGVDTDEAPATYETPR